MAKIAGAQYQTGYLATYYDPALGGINTDGDPTATSTGTTFTYYQSMAVDPKVIPYGSVVHVHIPGNPKFDQIWLASDTGGAIKGKRLDLGLPKKAGFGKEAAEIAILEKGTGERSNARDKAKKWNEILAKYGNATNVTTPPSSSSSSSSTGNNGVEVTEPSRTVVSESQGVTGDISRLTEPGDKFQYVNPTMIRGKAPNGEDDDFPKHRYARNPFVLRIGDAQFFIPPTNISTSKVAMVDGEHTLRSKSMMVTKSGYTSNRLTIQLVFADVDQINGFAVEAPGDKNYYMDGLRALLAQFYLNPFMPIRNELINDRYGIFNVALESINLSTDPEIANMVTCELNLIECTVEPFLALPDFMYDFVFNYPLWRWYYHRMMYDEETLRAGSMYLKPIKKRMNHSSYFRVLSPTEIENMQEEVVKEVQEKAGVDVRLHPEYILSRFKLKDMHHIMSDWDIGGAVCTGVRIGINKELTPIHIEDFEMPCFQDLGGLLRVFVMDFYCTSRDELESLVELVKHTEMTAREYRHRFVGGFVAIDNDLVNLAGIEYAMPLNIETSTVENVDDNYIVSISFQEFNVHQKENEKLHAVDSYLQEFADNMNKEFKDVFEISDKSNHKPEIVYENFIEESLGQMVLYPDLDLPEVERVNKAISTINRFRVSKGHKAMPLDKIPVPDTINMYYVEPDFYMIYPSQLEAYEAIGIQDFGFKITNLIANNNYRDVQNEYEDITNQTDGISITEVIDSLSTRFVDNQSNPFEFQEIIQGAVNTQMDWTMAAKTFKTPAFTNWGQENTIPTVEETLPMMLHDFVRYDNRYRMTRAFPTYLVLFVDEGVWVNGSRLWNKHYAYHAIHEISVVRDKNNPVDLAYIRLSNIYSTFNNEVNMKDPRAYGQAYGGTFSQRWGQLVDGFSINAESLASERNELMDTASLKEGARIHIRMGYSSNATNLPICFNGHIASVNDGPLIDIVAQSDGVELINNILSTNKNEGTPNEPHNAFQRYLTARQSNYWFSASSEFEFFNNYESRYGIEHFGWVESLSGGNSLGFWTGVASGVLSAIPLIEKDTKEALSEFIGKFFDGIIVDNLSYISGVITGHPPFNTYDIMKNIYRGAAQPRTGVINYKEDKWKDSGFSKFMDDIIDKWWVFDGENNVNFSVYNKTLWDLGQQYSAFVPEFIFSPHYHGLRSTLFFGMPHWPVKYAYVKKEGAGGLATDDYEEAFKPFQQLHIYNNGIDIIKNNIKASSEHIKHVATGIYMRGDISTIRPGITVYADRSIVPSSQKGCLIDTGVFQDLFGPDAIIDFTMKYVIKGLVVGVVGIADSLLEISETISAKVAELLGWEWTKDLHEFIKGISDWVDTDTVSDFFNKISEPGKTAALTITIGTLQRHFMEMYQGELIVFGDGSLKPWDLFSMNDQNLLMSGTAQVGKVTHSMSRSTGYITVIKPDLVVGRTDGRGGRNIILQSIATIGSGIGVSAARLVINSKLFRRLMKRSAMKSWNGLEKFSKVTAYKVKGKAGLRKAVSFFDDVRDIWNAEKTTKAFGWGKKLIKGNLFFTLTVGAIGEGLMTWFDKQTKYNNVLFIYPLWKSSEPFAAGIRGAAHIIPGYMDPRYADPLGMGEGYSGFTQSSTKYNDDDSRPSGRYPGDETGGTSGTSQTSYSVTGGVGVTGSIAHPLLKPTRVTSHYGKRWGTMHYGTDLAPYTDKKGNKITTPIHAIADGVVIFQGFGKWEGNWIQILHNINGKDVISAYKHFAAPASVKAGTAVKKGQEIGIMGTTGDSTGIHLHFEILERKTYKYGQQINPINFYNKMGVRLE